jgi:DNA-binding IclR family transcriptional regulator
MAANKSVEKTIKILQFIAKNPDGVTLSEIYKELKLPKASVFDILQALYKEDALYYKDENIKNYVIGSKLYTIGQAYTKNSNFINFASNSLKEFANKYNMTTFAVKRLGDKVIYIYKYESPNTRIITSDIGVQMPLYSNAAGKAFLAFLNEEKRNSLLSEIKENEFDGIETENYLKLVKSLNSYRELGYVFDDGETEDYIRHFAVPVYNFENKASGVIAASGLMNGYSEEEITNQINEFKQIAGFISERQGYKKIKKG